MTNNRRAVIVSTTLTTILLSMLSVLPLQTASAMQVCSSAATDFDGDGWGYENGQSCVVEASITPNNTCLDFDGDGWGWNGLESCRVAGDASDNEITSSAQVCSDPDGDGWGWNGTASCRVATQSLTVEPPVQPEVTVQSAVPEVTTAQVPIASTVAQTALTSACATTLSAGANLVNATTSTSGKICLRPGNYSLPGNLSLRSNQTLIALDPSNPPTINTSAVRTFSTTGRDNVTIESIIIDGNGTGASEFAILIGSGSSNITLNNVTIRNTFGIGVGITNATNVTINGGTITNIGLDPRLRQAVWTTTNSRNVTIDGLTVRGRQNDTAGGDHAITCIDAVNGFTVTNSRSEYAGSGAVAINNCSNIVVTNNELHDGREHGVDIVNGSVGALVRGNNITGMDRSAMVFDDHSWQCASCGANPTEITVSNNRMSGNNRVNLARCKGIAVDSQMTINPTSQQLNNDWVQIDSNNQVDSDSALHCDHIH